MINIVKEFSKAVFLVPINENTWNEVNSVSCKLVYGEYVCKLDEGGNLVFSEDEANELIKETYLKKRNIIYPLLKQNGIPILDKDGKEIS